MNKETIGWFYIPVGNLPSLETQIATLNKRAARAHDERRHGVRAHSAAARPNHDVPTEANRALCGRRISPGDRGWADGRPGCPRRSPRSFAGNYGPTTLCMFEDAAGNSVKWFASGDPELQIGTTYDVKATPKSHGEYKGRNETLVSRAVCTPVLALAPAEPTREVA